MNLKNFLQKVVEYGFYLFVFLLPWQTRWIIHQGTLAGGAWEYGTLSLYGTDILLVIVLCASLALPARRTAAVRSIWAGVAGLFFIAFASVLWSVNKEVSWYALAKLLEGIGLFWLAVRLKIKWSSAGLALAAAGVVQSVLAIYQFFSQNIIASKWLGMAAHSPETLGDFVVLANGGRWLRAYGSLPHPNILAGFLVICLIVLIGFLIVWQSNWRANKLKLLLSAAAMVIVSFALILTFSRSAYLALALALLLGAAVSLWRKDFYRLRVLSQVIVWLLLVALMSVLLVPEVWQTRLEAAGPLENKSIVERTTGWEAAAKIIDDNLLQGVGLGVYTQALYNRQPSTGSYRYQPVHNIYLLAAAETGIFGALIFLLIIFEFMRCTFTRHKRQLMAHHWFFVFTLAFIALLVIGLVDHYLWSLSFGILLFWLVLGLWTSKYNEAGEE